MKNENGNFPGRYEGQATSLIVLNTSKGKVTIPTDQIIRIKAISNYSKLFFENGKSLVVAKVLRWFEEQHSLFSFIRIHRSHLINIHYIKSYSASNGLLCMQTSEIFPVSKRKKTVLAKQLGALNKPLAIEPAAATPLLTKKIMAA